MAASFVPVAVADVLLSRIVCSATDQISLNMLAYTVQAVAGAGSTLRDAAVLIDTNFAAAIKPCLGVPATYYGVGCRKFIAGGRLSAENSTTASTGPGTGGALLIARQTCGLITKQTVLGGRGGRGRMYVPFPGTASCDTSGVPTAGYLANIGTIGTALLATLTNAGGLTLIPVLLRYPRPNRLPPVAIGTTPLTGFTARLKWATHRTRGSYGKTNALPF